MFRLYMFLVFHFFAFVVFRNVFSLVLFLLPSLKIIWVRSQPCSTLVCLYEFGYTFFFVPKQPFFFICCFSKLPYIFTPKNYVRFHFYEYQYNYMMVLLKCILITVCIRSCKYSQYSTCQHEINYYEQKCAWILNRLTFFVCFVFMKTEALQHLMCVYWTAIRIERLV